jgi:hypothetical protein
MFEGRIRCGRSKSHPEMKGQELDTIPVTSHTVDKLKTTMTKTLRGKTMGLIVSGDNEYHLIDAHMGHDIVGSVNQQGNGTTPDINYTIYQNESDLNINKSVTDPTKVNKIIESALEEVIYTSGETIRLAKEAGEASARNAKEIEELTGLPNISEGEIRRLIQNLKSGTLKGN